MTPSPNAPQASGVGSSQFENMSLPSCRCRSVEGRLSRPLIKTWMVGRADGLGVAKRLPCPAERNQKESWVLGDQGPPGRKEYHCLRLCEQERERESYPEPRMCFVTSLPGRRSKATGQRPTASCSVSEWCGSWLSRKSVVPSSRMAC